jgi:hypothetical protein
MDEFGLEHANLRFWCTENRRHGRVLKCRAEARPAGLGEAGRPPTEANVPRLGSRV